MDPAIAVIVYIFIATFGIFVFSMISFSRIQKKRHYKCPHCGYRYKPGSMTAFFSKRENVTDRLLECPRCGQRNFMENIDDAAYDAEKDAEKDEPKDELKDEDKDQ